MGQSSDEIRQEIDQQRAEAGQKIDNLQHQVQGQADHAREQVLDTADQVRGEAKALVNDTVDTVKESFDFHEQVQQRPLVAAGAALLGGFVLGSITGGGDQHGGHRSSSQSYGSGDTTSSGYQYSGGQHSGGGTNLASGIRTAAQKSGLEDTISNATAALMGSLTEQLKTTLDQRFPGYSDKMETAEHQSGSFTDKAKATQKEAQQA